MLSYALLILGIAALLGGLFLRRRRCQSIENRDRYYSIRSVLPKGGDPFENRIEFHCTRRSHDTGS